MRQLRHRGKKHLTETPSSRMRSPLRPESGWSTRSIIHCSRSSTPIR
ncbi:rCG37370 [Rattus norvegicus]|uniref:RCG37370 n=1 Tax=Rattus norvegicus TaxID=10116 RepID=A6KIA9_RAT|nr:rCG37370 [Rattus norvegicus]